VNNDGEGAAVLGQQRPTVNNDGDGNTIWVGKSGGIILCRARAAASSRAGQERQEQRATLQKKRNADSTGAHQ